MILGDWNINNSEIIIYLGWIFAIKQCLSLSYQQGIDITSGTILALGGLPTAAELVHI